MEIITQIVEMDGKPVWLLIKKGEEEIKIDIQNFRVASINGNPVYFSK